LPPVNTTGLSAWMTVPVMSAPACHCTYCPAMSVNGVVTLAGAAGTVPAAGSAWFGRIWTLVLSSDAVSWPHGGPDESGGLTAM
jgi:hypothetical protein